MRKIAVLLAGTCVALDVATGGAAGVQALITGAQIDLVIDRVPRPDDLPSDLGAKGRARRGSWTRGLPGEREQQARRTGWSQRRRRTGRPAGRNGRNGVRPEGTPHPGRSSWANLPGRTHGTGRVLRAGRARRADWACRADRPGRHWSERLRDRDGCADPNYGGRLRRVRDRELPRRQGRNRGWCLAGKRDGGGGLRHPVPADCGGGGLGHDDLQRCRWAEHSDVLRGLRQLCVVGGRGGPVVRPDTGWQPPFTTNSVASFLGGREARCRGDRGRLRRHARRDRSARRRRRCRRRLEAAPDAKPLRRRRGRHQRGTRKRSRGQPRHPHLRHGQGLRLSRRPGLDRDPLPRSARRHLPARALGSRLLPRRGRPAGAASVRCRGLSPHGLRGGHHGPRADPGAREQPSSATSPSTRSTSPGSSSSTTTAARV